MSKRVTRSILDPFMLPYVPAIYRRLPIPRWFPPEGIVLTGHLLAIGGAVGLGFSTYAWWGGLLAAAGVAGNHFCDMVDGTHARQTGQCRNGGELLDHLTDPVSFCYWIIGLAVSMQWGAVGLSLGLAGVMVLLVTALLTSIKAKLIGSFELARFGPTEFKAMLTVYGLAMAVFVAATDAAALSFSGFQIARCFFLMMLVIGAIQLPWNLYKAIRDVNRSGAKPDTSEWEMKDSD